LSQSNANLYAHFREQFKRFPDKIALETPDGLKWSYEHLDREAARIANFLSGKGIKVGDRVSVQVAKSPEALILYLACVRAGFVYHPLNTGYKESELSYFLGNAEPAAVICDSRDRALMEKLCTENAVPILLTLNADGTGSLTDEAADFAADYPVIERKPDDMAALLYSSGTTGRPKGIMLTNENLLSNAQSLVEGWGFTDKDVLLHALPIFHVHGLFVALGCVFLSGASMRWLAGFDLDQVLGELPKSTVMMGVPTYYTRLLSSDRLNADLVANMRLFISGSAPLLAETFEEFEQVTGHRILERYGMSETNMNTSNPLHGERKPGTVGPALPGVEVRVVDDNNGPLPTGEIGNLQVRGPNVFKGYWKMPDKTAEDFTPDGYFNTGDKGLIDADGYVSIVGRSKDMVITGGLNVYPKELELLIDEQDGVLESAVIGVPHKDFGEAVVAVVIPRAGVTLNEATLIDEIKDQMSGFKVPKRIVFLDALPRNTMGKVQKNILREQFGDLFT
jgi:malonyl-CoA/methylmalonyl-CoA synthetase